MTDVAWCDPERWGLDDMPLLVAEARASGDQQLEAEVLRRYGFAVPTDDALDAIVACSPRGVLELGAGTGHWAALLARRGVDVIAYDVAPPLARQRVVRRCAALAPCTSGRRARRQAVRRSDPAPRLADVERDVGV